MQPKYISKQYTQINSNLAIAKYFYDWGVAVYIIDKRFDSPLVVNVHFNEIERAMAKKPVTA